MTQVNRPVPRGPRISPVTDWNNPRATAQCDGCGLITYRDQLQMQKEYRGGMSPVATGSLKCPKCLDAPNAQFMLQVNKPDPVPVYMPRPDDDAGAARSVTTTPVTLLTTNSIILVNVAAPVTINLPASPTVYLGYLVEDTSGAARTYPITIVPAAGTINDAASYAISTNYGIAHLVYSGGQWNAT